MTSIAQVSDSLTVILETVPKRVARETGCIKRQGKFTGATLVSTVVLGLLRAPEATLEELTQMAGARGVTVSAQGLDQRFTPAFAATLKEVLAAAVGQVVTGDAVAIPLLARFNGVYIQDCSTISLPPALASVWPGCGGTGAAGQTAIKLGGRLDLLGGRFEGPYLASGRTHDRAVPHATDPLPPTSLWMGDLGLVTLARLATIAAEGGYWLTRIKANTHIETEDGQVWEQLSLLAIQDSGRVELVVRLGKRARIPARLLAIRVPEAVAEERRERLRAAAAGLIAARLVFVDECGAHLAHTRAYAYAPRHERAVGRVPKNRGRVTTLIASLTPTGMGPHRTLLGGTSKAVFLSYLREELAPALTPGQVVILDNLGAHRPQEVAAMIEERGARVLYLPGYSPDFNPIELAFGKLKALLRQTGARTRDALETAIAAALEAITRDDATAFFVHCGFPLSTRPQGQD